MSMKSSTSSRCRAALFVAVLHPWLMNSGSTSDEQAMVLPGDAADPSAHLTRAINIDAPPAAVWPWLMQIGQDRAGFHSNDYLENLTGANIHNADVLRPDWQVRALGDKVRVTSPQETAVGGEATLLTVRILDPRKVYADVPGRIVLLPVGGPARACARVVLPLAGRPMVTNSIGPAWRV
jgi:hypothetical protein